MSAKILTKNLAIISLLLFGATEVLARDCLRTVGAGERYVRFLGEAGPTSPDFPQPFTYDLCYRPDTPRFLNAPSPEAEATLTWKGTGSLYFQADSTRIEFTNVTNVALSNNAHVPPDTLHSSIDGPETIPGFSLIEANRNSLIQFDGAWRDNIPSPERIADSFYDGAIAFSHEENPGTPIHGPITHAFADTDILNVYLVAGQSNASGRSVSPLLPAPSDAEVKRKRSINPIC